MRRQPSRGMYVLPSLFTAGNMAAGYYAITQSIQGSVADQSYFDRAALALGIAVLFDGLDGIIARMTNTTSDFGRELDSLADVITFGVAPSLLAYIWGFRMLPSMAHPEARQQIVHIGVFVCFIFLICGASRLARFNISINPQPRNPGRPGKKYFVGMPIPAGAGVISSVVHFQRGSPIDNPWVSVVWLCLLLFTSFLMVSNWRFWSAKEITVGARHPYRLFAVIAVVGASIALYHQYMLIIIAMAYLVSGVVARLAYSWGRARRHSSGVLQ
ncbi:CDP-diacylglycerol--serine O-phosphatidyltransferase [Tunturiibacter gelidoferens]|uniref:CDP-diacylglycerol--serine O-phosphatidyltransferase n=1 Tax=Tunturiibacter gelidiferens TaxID=3069689 RepID=A0A9X0U659_9BACT|nr:CDP-diacylglycerol--serine O-phosphatidyltransferase [Edaphobacter lichenicola]MBB5331133.1 CDP-diacylglycerol--serine O-phosphatidyltransferase [Edaphobacter lichenicola]